jgi:hypothetical protein
MLYQQESLIPLISLNSEFAQDYLLPRPQSPEVLTLGKSWLAVNSVYRICPGAKFPAFTPLLQIIGQIPVVERSFQAHGNAITRG